MRHCEIVYVKEKETSGWKWRAIADEGEALPKKRVCARAYRLFYECVIDARASGYSPLPALKCL